MIPDPDCELCGTSAWRSLGTRTYSIEQQETPSAYVAKRLTVLFEVWFPGTPEVIIESVACEKCAFIAYRPRPTPTDIDSKYAKLESLGNDYGGATPLSSLPERCRSQSLWCFLDEHVDTTTIETVLDFGGGDGRLMDAFIENGKKANLLDYNPRSVPGVERLGSTTADLAPDQKFDLILCSHVLEHVAQPRSVVTLLAAHLNPGGYIYAEVPLEVWATPPLPTEPVTHINFFTPNSFQNLFGLAGLDPGVCTVAPYPHPSGGEKPAIRIIAAKPFSDEPSPPWHLLPPDNIPLFDHQRAP